MKALIQRVSSAKVEVDGNITGAINQGILVFIGIEKADEKPQVDKIIKKLLAYRVFYDDDDTVINKSSYSAKTLLIKSNILIKQLQGHHWSSTLAYQHQKYRWQ
jgi:D-tyrosyl-tRNA(Tyr) deacylase